MQSSQIRGLIAIFLFLAIIPFIFLYQKLFQTYKIPVFADYQKDSIVIEINGKETVKGIYFIEADINASQFFKFINYDFSPANDFSLKNSMKLIIDSESKNKISVSSIDNLSRLALGMPIDLNSASEDDLLLIPGIGEATAQKILNLRNKKIHFRKVEELMEIKGIKEKRLAKLKPYLFLQK